MTTKTTTTQTPKPTEDGDAPENTTTDTADTAPKTEAIAPEDTPTTPTEAPESHEPAADDQPDPAARVQALEAALAAAELDALRARVQARHGISDEDADLFLTGTDEDTLTAQAQALAARQARHNGPYVKQQANAPHTPTAKPTDPVRGLLADRGMVGRHG